MRTQAAAHDGGRGGGGRTGACNLSFWACSAVRMLADGLERMVEDLVREDEVMERAVVADGGRDRRQ